MTFPATPLPVTVEINPNGVGWTDITSKVRGDQQQVSITRGKPDETATVDTQQVSLVLDNRTGDLCPTNASGQWYGKIGRNTPIRAWLPAALTGLDVPARDGSVLVNAYSLPTVYPTCPDNARLHITGDIDVRFDGDLNDWSGGRLLQKWDVGADPTYMVSLGEARLGSVRLSWLDGATRKTADSTVPLPRPWSGRKAVRATAHFAAGTATVTFYTSDTIDGTWTQLGATVSVSSTGITSTTDTVRVLRYTYGRVYALKVLSGIAGTEVANPNWRAAANGATTLTDAAGNVWTWSGCEVNGKDARFTGEVSSWPLSWDVTGRDIYASVTAGGVLRRLQNITSPVLSPFFQGTIAQADLTDYWPCEDASSATQLASAVGGAPMTWSTATASLASDSAFACSKPLPLVGSNYWTGVCKPGGDWSAGTVAVRMLLDAQSIASGAILMRIRTNGQVAYWDLIYTSPDTLTLKGYKTDWTLAFTDGPWAPMGMDGKQGWLSVELTQTGTTCQGRLVWLPVGAVTGVIGNNTATIAGGVGQPLIVYANASANAGAGVAFGHVSVHNAITSIFDLRAQLNAYSGETAGKRILRVTQDANVSCLVLGGDAATATMGPQTIDTPLNIIREAEAADGGILYEPRDMVGLVYRGLADMGANAETQAKAATLSYSGADLSSIAPTFDDFMSGNDWTVTRTSGSSATRAQTSGPMSTAQPPAGIGDIKKSATVNVFSDNFLDSIASWRLALGTYAGARYPTIGIRMARANYAGNATKAAAVSALDVGDFLTISNWDLPGYPPDDVRQVVLGFKETLSNYVRDIEFQCAPGDPWVVGINGDANSRYDTEASALHSGVTTTGTSWSVDTVSGPRWITTSEDAGAFPFDIVCEGERVTVTAISGTSSPQTFTVTRHANGVVKAHSTGAALSLARPVRYGMES